MKRLIWLAVVPFWLLVGCGGPTPTPAPTATIEVIIIPVVATPVSTATALATPSPSPTATSIPVSPTPPRTATRTLTRPTPTRPRVTASPAPTTSPPDTLLDGSYTGSGSIRVQFTVSGNGTVASGGFFSFHCPVDQALSTYGFTEPAPIAHGKFEFTAVPAPSGASRVSMACSATTSTQARCVIRNLLATNKCLDTPANASRK